MSNQRPRSLLWTLFANGLIVFFALGAYNIWQGFYDDSEARLSEEWPSVEGTILSHSVRSRHHYWYSWTTHYYHYEPIVWYAYTVEQVPYKDSRIAWYSLSFSTESEAHAYMDQDYPVGGNVRVYYDPQQPHHACLVAGGGRRAREPIYLGLIQVGLAVVVVLSVRQRK